MEDSYLKKVDANVVLVKDKKFVVLDKTIFYPDGGGQPYDTGKIIHNEKVFDVVYVGKFSGEISHEVDKIGLKEGVNVECIIDWERRYQFMKSHTAAHVFASLLCRDTGALVTGNRIEKEKVRFDFNLKKFDKAMIQKYIDKANILFKNDISVSWYWIPREEALKIPGIVKMAGALPPEIPNLRIVEILGVDKQADGGTHVKNLCEIGQIELIKIQNKGKNNRRVYFKLT